MLFPFLTVFVVFLLLLAWQYRRKDQYLKEIEQSFWEKEAMANATPPADLDSLKYITIPLEKFPLGFSQEPEIVRIEQALRDLSNKRILNLTGKTNTDLKATYGVSNLETMSEIGDNFDQLTMLLKDYANLLLENDRMDDAIYVLEFGVGIGSDISQNYTMLGDCYQALGKTDKLNYLIEQVKATEFLLTPSILRHLEQLQTPSNSKDSTQEDFPV